MLRLFRNCFVLFIFLIVIVISKCEDFILIPHDYNKSKAPIPGENNKTEIPLIVDVDIWVWAVTEVSAQRMEIKVDMYITFVWMDYRLNISSHLIPDDEDDWLPVGNSKHGIWLPYVTFRNCIGCTPIDLDTKKTDVLFHPKTHQLKILTRTLTNFACNIYLANYPMDRQYCNIQLENYYEDISELRFRHIFPESYKKVASNQTLAEYQMATITPGDCTAPIFDGREYSCIEMNFVFVRQIGYYVCTLYAPTFLLVVLSWMSFWIPPEPLQARITLGVTALLTLATRLDQSQKNLPPVSYIKAIDVWLFVCIFSVFASLIELAFAANYLQKTKNQQIPIIVSPAPNATDCHDTTKKPAQNTVVLPSSGRNVTFPDRLAKFIFPLTFILFNIIYWSKYLTIY